MRSLALVLPVVAACGVSSNATLADLPGLKLSVQTWAATDTSPTHGFVTLGYDETAFRAAHGGECATIEMSGTRNGNAMPADGGGHSDEDDDCYAPSFDLTGDFAGAQTLEVKSGATTITAAYATDALAPHTATLISPAQWKLSAGQAVQVRWSAPDDLAQLTPEPFQVYFHTGKTENNNSFDLSPTFDADQISWTMPSPLPRAGAGLIVFRFGYSTGTAERCTGATECTYSAERGYEHSVTLTP